MTKTIRWALVCLGTMSVAFAAWGAVALAESSTPSHAAATRSVPDPLKSVTAYQLGQTNLELADPIGTPSVSVEDANKVAQSVFPDPIRESVAQSCTVVDSALQKTLCWVVVLDPQDGSAIPLQGPDAAFDEEHSKRPTVEVVLVDGNDGSVLVAFQNGFPPEAPTPKP
jgi:hypothetical protein